MKQKGKEKSSKKESRMSDENLEEVSNGT